ncbi:TetR/AcrR family transcriptional regulator [Roseovarius sp.]|uniref:TetR/AcrR family transcriptional regulator n=1 Tax=Roseovarius sp. TaxID=1486281 RepID=UPI003515455C
MTDDTTENQTRKPPKRRRTQDERSAATIENLCKTTVELIAEIGFVNVTTTKIARRAGISRGAILHHFDSKADLVKRATALMWSSVVDCAAAISDDHKDGVLDPKDLIDRAWTGLMSDQYVTVSIDMMAAARGDPDLNEHVELWINRMVESYRETAREIFCGTGMSEADAESLMLVLTSTLRGLRVAQMIEPDPDKAEAALATLANLIRARLASEGAS